MATVETTNPTESHSPQRRRWTRAEYYQLYEQGFFQQQRVELVNGEILIMSPQGPRHSSTVELVAAALRHVLGPSYWVRVQFPLALGKHSEPEPDIAVVKGTPRTIVEHPKSALLVVEVSGTTRVFDRGDKAQEYAKAGIEDYWVVDLQMQVVVVHRQPKKSRYTNIVDHFAGESLSLLALPKRKVKVDDLLL